VIDACQSREPKHDPTAAEQFASMLLIRHENACRRGAIRPGSLAVTAGCRLCSATALYF